MRFEHKDLCLGRAPSQNLRRKETFAMKKILLLLTLIMVVSLIGMASTRTATAAPSGAPNFLPPLPYSVGIVQKDGKTTYYFGPRQKVWDKIESQEGWTDSTHEKWTQAGWKAVNTAGSTFFAGKSTGIVWVR